MCDKENFTPNSMYINKQVDTNKGENSIFPLFFKIFNKLFLFWNYYVSYSCFETRLFKNRISYKTEFLKNRIFHRTQFYDYRVLGKILPRWRSTYQMIETYLELDFLKINFIEIWFLENQVTLKLNF